MVIHIFAWRGKIICHMEKLLLVATSVCEVQKRIKKGLFCTQSNLLTSEKLFIKPIYLLSLF